MRNLFQDSTKPSQQTMLRTYLPHLKWEFPKPGSIGIVCWNSSKTEGHLQYFMCVSTRACILAMVTSFNSLHSSLAVGSFMSKTLHSTAEDIRSTLRALNPRDCILKFSILSPEPEAKYYERWLSYLICPAHTQALRHSSPA